MPRIPVLRCGANIPIVQGRVPKGLLKPVSWARFVSGHEFSSCRKNLGNREFKPRGIATNKHAANDEAESGQRVFKTLSQSSLQLQALPQNQVNFLAVCKRQ